MVTTVDLLTVSKLHDLILQKKTGTNHELMRKLNISRSTLYDLLDYLKEVMRAPIIYNKKKKTYEYEYLPRFYLSDEIVQALTLMTANGSKERDRQLQDSDLEDDDRVLDDRLEPEELENFYGGEEQDDYYRQSPDDWDNVILEGDINFNDLCVYD